MQSRIFREYKFKFYLNGGHHILIDGHQGAVHPHTWEFTIKILIKKDGFLEFNVFEKAVALFFEKYQNQTLNLVKPFDAIMPTLENMVEYFGEQLREVIRTVGGELLEIEGSETPTRSYIVSYSEDQVYLESVRGKIDHSVSRMMERMLDVAEGEKRE